VVQRSLWLLAAATAAICAGPAEAHHSASSWHPLYRERYLICTDAKAATRVHCVGPVKARAAMLAALKLGDLAPGKNHDHWVDPAHEAAVDAAYFHVADAIPALRTWLEIRLDAADQGNYTQLEKNGLRTEAAFALAQLGDRASVQPIADLVVELETTGSGTLWEDALAALAVLDPARASRYAIDFLGRQTDFRMSLPGGSSKLLALDDVLEASPVLEQLAKRGVDDHTHCELMATRVRLEPKLHAEVRKLFASSYSGTWLAGCAESVLQRLPPDPDDAAILVRHLGRDDLGMDYGVTNLAYERVLDLEVAMIGRHDAAADRARDLLRRGLDERSKWPHVADPTHANYSPHFVALHEAALAGVGDTAAAAKLAAIIDDPNDRTGTAWLGALYALRLDLPGAVEHAAALVARGVAYANEEHTGALFGGLRRRVLDAFVARAPDDGRWAVMLLDGELRSEASEHALDLLARHPPRGACEAVIAAAPKAHPEAVEHALLALTVLGDACLPPIEQLADDGGGLPLAGSAAEGRRGVDDGSAPSQVRGAALEFTAVLESPRLCAHLARAKADGVWHPAIERAEALRQPRCEPMPRGDQPVPPRVFHQGQ
jgi:hypothetical protein